MARKRISQLIAMLLIVALPFFPSIGYSKEKSAPVTDDWIVATSKFMMEQDGRLDPMKIQVKSKDGTVVLRGSVKTDYEKARAEHILTTVPGVKKVQNDLVVAASNDSDEKLAQQVRTNLLESPKVHVIGLSVDVKDGVAQVHGIARDPSQKELVNKMVRMTPGIKGVDNEIIVAPRPA